MTDTLGNLEALSELLLATSLGTERLIAIVKTFCPWLAIEKTNADQAVDLKKDMGRRLAVQGLAVLGSLVTVCLVFDTVNPIKQVSVGGQHYYVLLLAFLGSAGSAFWGGIVGYVKEIKDLRTVQKAAARRGFVRGPWVAASEGSATGLTG